MTQYSRSLTLLKIGCFYFMIFLNAYCYFGVVGWGYWFCKMKVLHWFNYATIGVCFSRQSLNYWYQDVERGWRAEVGIRRGRKLDPIPLFWAQSSHSTKRAPAVAMIWQSLGSNFWQFHCCPDPPRQSSIQAPRVYLQEKTQQTLMHIHCLGSQCPRFPQTIPGQGRKVLRPSAGSRL